MDDLDRAIVDALQEGFPVCDRPFLTAARRLGTGETDLIARVGKLLASGVLTRFGPLYQVERMGGTFLLAAMSVPEERFDEVAAAVNALPEVAHNYRREHTFNMWFVLAAESEQATGAAIATIEAETRLPVLALPKEREYFVELKLPVAEKGPGSLSRTAGASSSEKEKGSGSISRMAGASSSARPEIEPGPFSSSAGSNVMAEIDRAIVRATQAGLPLVPRPYHAIATAIGVGPELVMMRIEGMLGDGRIRRIGAVPNHYALGYRANGMSVWDVADERVDELGGRVGALSFVSHCYRRPRRLPQWRYNLFAMLHGRDRGEVERQVAAVAEVLGNAARAHEILYSTHILKKTGLRLRDGAAPRANEFAPTS